MKTTLKHILQVDINPEENPFGRGTQVMIWSPVDHCWLFEDDIIRINDKYFNKFLLKQEVVRIGLRNDMPGHIAIFLKDYGKEKNKKIRKKYKR